MFGRKLESFRRLSGRDRAMALEAALMLAVARLLVVTTPFRLVAPWLRRAPDGPDVDDEIARAVGQAVTLAARNVPWNAVCLPQAIAAKAMLARRGLGSAFHLGAGFDQSGKLIAHAWLVAGGRVVVGGAAMSDVTPLARFG